MRPFVAHCGIAMSTLILAVNIAPGQGITLPGGLVVETRLKAMSKVPTLKDLSTYKESLIASRWEVTEVIGGTLKDKEIIVYHWSYLDSKFQEAVKWKVGDRRTLNLRPFAEVPLLARLRKDEDAAVEHLHLPVYYDIALGRDLPPVLAKAMTSGKILDVVKKNLGKDLGKVLAVNGADCHSVNDFHLLYGGTGRGKVVGIGGPGSFFSQHELGFRVAVAECPNLEWGIESGSRVYGGSNILAGPAWPALPGRSLASPISGAIEVVVLPGVESGRVEGLGVFQNIIREYGRRGKGFVFDPSFHLAKKIYDYDGTSNPVFHERFTSWGKVYPNFIYLDLYSPDAIKILTRNHWSVSSANIEKARVAADAGGLRAKLIPWSHDPADAKPDTKALASAVQAVGRGGDVVVGGTWMAKVIGDTPGMAAFADAGIAEAELTLRSAVAANRKPKQVVWGIEPHMLTAPQTEQSIGPLPGPNWPMRFGGPFKKPLAESTPLIQGAYPRIRLGHGTTVARGKGFWEFGLESSLILEATLREISRHQIGAVLVLGPNSAGIPDVAYEGLADRLRAYSLLFPGVRFVEPADIAGKTDSEIRTVIEAHLGNPTRGVMKSSVPPVPAIVAE